jgi:hypothetical protein
MVTTFVIGGCFLLYFFIKSCLVYRGFHDYLLRIKDEETLKMIKKINPLGRPTLPNTPFTLISVHRELLEKYNQTGDNYYFEFGKRYMQCIKRFGIIGGILFMLYVFYQIIMSCSG